MILSVARTVLTTDSRKLFILTHKPFLIRMGENYVMTIILIAIGLLLLGCSYYFLIKPALKLRKLNKEIEKQEIKKKGRRKSWQKSILPPSTYPYRK